LDGNAEDGPRRVAPRQSLLPYLPRLVLDWQADEPAATHRELDATMVVIDISGFTAMSERLATQGRVGSEEVTEVLDAVFTQLLSVAYADGGSLVKFGGDALLLLFDGPGHAHRGVHAAAGMRRTLRECGTVSTSVGRIRLRMSVGVHSGRFLMVLAGHRHRELVVTGPGVTTAVEMEHAASAGEILLSPATAAAVDPNLLGEERHGGFLLRRTPLPPRAISTISLPTDRIDVADFVPEALREHLASAGGTAEHRQVTVGFVRFGEVDLAYHRDGPSAVAAAVDEVVRVAQDAAAAYGVTFLGTDVDADGGKVILVAGVPHASDSDEERMLRAACAVLDAQTTLPVRIGVNRGHVFVGDVGPSYRRTYTAMGDAVNLAARLMAHAGHRELVASTDTLDRVSANVTARPVPSFRVKGKRLPVSAAQVRAVRAAAELTRVHNLPLLGRDTELAVLVAAAQRAATGALGVVEVIGEAGVGKSRLVAELLERVASPVVVFASCSPYDVATPYAAARVALRRLLRISDDASAAEAGVALHEIVAAVDARLLPWLPLLAIPVGATVPSTLEAETIAAEFRADRMRRAVADLVSEVCRTPTLMVLEDTHWVDDASAELLRHALLSVGRDVPLLVCMTRREDVGGVPLDERLDPVRIALPRLGDDATKALAVAASEGLLLPEPHLDAVAGRSGGLPLFLRELVREVAHRGSVDALPDTVEAVITARLDELPLADRTLLRHAAVLGASFPAALLDQVLGVAPDERSWRRLAAFLESDGDTVRFRQSLFHEVAYENLPFRLRRTLHARAGELILAQGDTTGESAALLSLHFHRAQAWDRAWEFSRIAGQRAQDTFANVEAATLLRRAVEAGRHLAVPATEIAAVWESLGDVLHLSGLYAAATDAFASARRLAPPDALPVLLLKEGVVRERLGRYPQALRWFTRALQHAATDAAEEGATRHRVRIKLAVAITRHRQGNYRECIRLSKEVAREAEAIEDRASLAYAFFLLHTACGDLGTDEFPYFQGRALPIFESLGDLIGQANVLERLGIDAYYGGRWDEAADFYQRSGELREKAGHVVYSANSLHNVAEIRLDQGHPEEAADGFRHALRVWRSAGFAHGVVFATCALGRVALAAGRLEEAAELFGQAASTAQEIGAEHALVEVEGRRAEVELAAGDAATALRTATTALERAGRIGGMIEVAKRLQRVVAAAHLALGDAAAAAAALDALAAPQSRETTYETGLALLLRARVAEATGEDPTPYAERARATLSALGVEESVMTPQQLTGSPA